MSVPDDERGMPHAETGTEGAEELANEEDSDDDGGTTEAAEGKTPS